MRIRFNKISDDRHQLMVAWPDGRSETVSCETRSLLLHDLLHYAVESEARLNDGFWGSLAAGASLAALNARAAGVASLAASTETLDPADADVGLLLVERVVGALHGTTKGIAAGPMFEGLQRFASAIERPWPGWLDEAFVERMIERMRVLRGRWAATPFGGTIELRWLL